MVLETVGVATRTKKLETFIQDSKIEDQIGSLTAMMRSVCKLNSAKMMNVSCDSHLNSTADLIITKACSLLDPLTTHAMITCSLFFP